MSERIPKTYFEILPSSPKDLLIRDESIHRDLLLEVHTLKEITLTEVCFMYIQVFHSFIA